MGPDEFKSHGVDDAAQLSAYSRTEEYASDEALFRLGDHADELYLLLAGTVDLVGSDGTTKMSLSPGNVFGFVDSQLGKPRTSSAFARAPALTSSPRDQDSRLLGTTPPPTQLQAPQEGVGATTPRAGVGQQSSSPFVVQVAAISMASLERMSADHPRIAVKLMKVLLRQSSLELSQQH